MMKRAATILIIAVALAMTAKPLLRGEVFTFRDHVGYFQPLRWFTATELHNGRLPLWNPYNASGERWLANPQTGVFYPPAWLFVFVPFARAYVIYLLLHVLLLGGGTFALFSRRLSPAASLVGAVGLMVCGPALSMLDVSNNYTTFAWLPLVLWCAVAEAGPRTSAMVMAMSFLAGEPFFAALGALAFAILRRRSPRVLAITALGTLGLTAVQLLPFLEMLRGSDRTSAAAPAELLRDSMPLRDWFRIAARPQLGSAVADMNLHQHFLPVIYCGVIVVLLALLAMATSLRRCDTQMALGVIVIAMIAAAGAHLAPVAWLYVHAPLKVFRYPARLMAIGALAIMALAAIGWEWIAARVTWRWLAFAVAAAISIDGLVQASPLLRSGPFRQRAAPYAPIIGRDAKFLRLPGPTWSAPGAWIDGYLNLFDRRFDAGTAAPLIDASYLALYEQALEGGRLEVLNTMSIGYLLTAGRLPPPFAPIARAGGVAVYVNPHVLPMAYFRGDDGRYRNVTFFSLGTSLARIDLDTPSSGLVILTQQDAPGWEVDVDGLRGNVTSRIAGVFRGVQVAGGHHVVEWNYRPGSLRVGAAGSLLALAWMLLGARAMRLPHPFVKR